MMGGIIGIFMIGFGILWTVFASQASPFFALFGVLWTGIAIAQTVYNFKNAKNKNRYSVYDITDSEEEPDPLNEYFGQKKPTDETDSEFCPYCGTKVDGDYLYCNKCGKKLP